MWLDEINSTHVSLLKQSLNTLARGSGSASVASPCVHHGYKEDSNWPVCASYPVNRLHSELVASDIQYARKIADKLQVGLHKRRGWTTAAGCVGKFAGCCAGGAGGYGLGRGECAVHRCELYEQFGGGGALRDVWKYLVSWEKSEAIWMLVVAGYVIVGS